MRQRNTSAPAVADALPSPAVALGIALVLIGMFLFSANDALGKWLVTTYSVGQVLLIRSAAALVALLPFIWLWGRPAIVSRDRPGIQALRVLFSTAEVFCFYSAVYFLPLADVMTFWLAAPIYVAALSPMLLGESVGWRRWTGIIVGFIGVIIVLNPSSATLTLPALISVVGSLTFALMMLTGRMLRRTPDTALVFWQTMGALIAGAVLAPWGWVQPTDFDWMLLGCLGIIAMGAHVLINRSLKLADAATIAPFQYTLLPWAVIFGYFFFGDIPRWNMLIGAAVIVGAGLYIYFREQRVKKHRQVVTTRPPGDVPGA
ncbi:DMT family transporter [Fodinicurvata sp. EGI_FJ10296]|uniref:DMT family transporter n=1 Tax=Fodinicurvata sp. EGI_FJ10296 TaxID=3231908 RepID=UPI003455537E